METLLFTVLSQTFTFPFSMLILCKNLSVITSRWMLFFFFFEMLLTVFFIQWRYVPCFVSFIQGPQITNCLLMKWCEYKRSLGCGLTYFFLAGIILLTLSKPALSSTQVVQTQALDIYIMPVSHCTEFCVLSHSTASSFYFFLLYYSFFICNTCLK